MSSPLSHCQLQNCLAPHDKTFLHMPLYTYVDICDVVVQASPCRTPSPTPLLTCLGSLPAAFKKVDKLEVCRSSRFDLIAAHSCKLNIVS